MKCNLCKSEISKPLFHYEKYPDGRVGDILRCKRCGLVYRINIQETHIGKSQAGQPTRRRSDYPASFTIRRERLFDYFLTNALRYRKYNRILDVGSGYGFFLKLCVEKGWQIWGVEVDPELVRFSMEELGIHVVNGKFEEVEYSDNFFDVVTFLNVLEHLPDPDFALKKSCRILRPGGALFLRIPNAAIHIPLRYFAYYIYRFWKGIKRFDASNINSYAFDSLSISRYLEKANFEDHMIDNDRHSRVYSNMKELSFEKTIKCIAIGLADIIKIISGGRSLIASSLSVKAIKPKGA